MADQMPFEVAPEVESADMVVVYDRETGAIRHAHRVFTLPGGRHPDREERERDALAHARRGHAELGHVELLHVDPRAVELEAVHRVDPRRRALVASPLPARRARRPS
jgi:hypothetical protein